MRYDGYWSVVGAAEAENNSLGLGTCHGDWRITMCCEPPANANRMWPSVVGRFAFGGCRESISWAMKAVVADRYLSWDSLLLVEKK
ncbi:hypothetical protein GQ55_4G115200 [Panicum hallii var. hallii]|uniref:Uncharacterized protein n=1 Tax=Panicum hallii var. hallii TaxID=1504633 RepID=A0A2T7DXM3_9POAL|nr:hypothetical protein GQ55_4G115200 [Panicum hallii var. hallii]